MNEWVTICGLSFASAWIEKFKQEAKMTTEKSKGLRKQLIPKRLTKIQCMKIIIECVIICFIS